jgi:hypothetical protein
MDALLNDLKELIKKSAVKQCIVGGWERSQDPELQELFVALQQAPGLNYSDLLAILKKHNPDLPFKRTSFTLHMKGQCACHEA